MFRAKSYFRNTTADVKKLILKSLLSSFLIIFLSACGGQNGSDGGGDTGDTTPPEITLLGANPFEIDMSSGDT